jgi:DNA-binding NarL/FixJ family response regulator
MGESVAAVRVLLVDDQELVRSGLRRILRRRDGFEIVAECADGDEIPGVLARTPVDVVVMDLRMRRVDGIEATRRLRAAGDLPPVLALTTFDDDELLSGVLRAGAAGFVLKDSPTDDLIRAVRVVAGGGSWLDPTVTARVLTTYRQAPAAASGAPRLPETLTAREVDVLQAMARGLSNSEIAQTFVISELTVKSHVGRIFAKLGLRDRAAAIVYAYEHGIAGGFGLDARRTIAE